MAEIRDVLDDRFQRILLRIEIGCSIYSQIYSELDLYYKM